MNRFQYPESIAPGNKHHWGELHSAGRALAIAEHAKSHAGLTVVITRSAREADEQQPRAARDGRARVPQLRVEGQDLAARAQDGLVAQRRKLGAAARVVGRVAQREHERDVATVDVLGQRALPRAARGGLGVVAYHKEIVERVDRAAAAGRSVARAPQELADASDEADTAEPRAQERGTIDLQIDRRLHVAVLPAPAAVLGSLRLAERNDGITTRRREKRGARDPPASKKPHVRRVAEHAPPLGTPHFLGGIGRFWI